jgi:hypothetical protein
LLHPEERRQLDKQVLQTAKEYFQNGHQLEDSPEFDRLWEELAEPIWTPATELTDEKFHRINRRFLDIVYNGKGIHDEEKESKQQKEEQETAEEKEDRIIDDMVQALFHGQSFRKTVLTREFVATIFYDAKPEILKKFFNSVGNEFVYLADHLPQNVGDEVLWNAYLGNLLAILPFSYPPNITEIVVPTKLHGAYHNIRYRIEKILLVITEYASPMSALGLTPIDNKDAPPILSYMGTTFPGAEGFLTSIIADTYPGYHVGERIYRDNKEKIAKWFKEGQKKHVRVVGISLGGILALHTVKDHHTQIARVDAYNPPGINADEWSEGISPTCRVNIYCQAGDVISKLGKFPEVENVTVYRVIAHQKGVQEDPFTSHARILTGCERVTIIKDDPKELNKNPRRNILTRLFRYLGPVLIFLPAVGALITYKATKSIYTLAKDTFWKKKE